MTAAEAANQMATAPGTKVSAAASNTASTIQCHHSRFWRNSLMTAALAAVCAPAPGEPGGRLLGWRCMASLASSAMPPSAPNKPADSIGIMNTFWFGEVANSFSASTYFCATK